MSEKPESPQKQERFVPASTFSETASVRSHAEYASLHSQSLEDPDTFWRAQTQDLVFRKTWQTFSEWELPKAKFFVGAALNLTESCLDRHLTTSARTRAAIVFEGEPGDSRTITYFELHREVVRLTAALLDLGIQAGDRVAIYMGMVPEAAIAMLACARIGATHSVVFGGFSSEALRDRINDLGAKALITQDGAWRRGNVVPLKKMADAALEHTPTVEHVVVFERIGKNLAPSQWQQAHGIGGLLNQLTGDTRKERALGQCGNGDGHRSSLSFFPVIAGEAGRCKHTHSCDHRHINRNLCKAKMLGKKENQGSGRRCVQQSP